MNLALIDGMVGRKRARVAFTKPKLKLAKSHNNHNCTIDGISNNT